jgi:hypothetical protein
MNDSDAVHGRAAISQALQAELAMLRHLLNQRGWYEEPNTTLWLCWRWPTSPPDGIDLFRAGPLIMFDEEDPTLGYLVESPLLHDTDAPVLRYRSVESLINILDRVETWTYPQQAADIDPDHTVRPGDIQK